jgi:hypothetical protein
MASMMMRRNPFSLSRLFQNNPSVRDIDGFCNLAGEVEDEAVIIPSIYANLKEEKA